MNTDGSERKRKFSEILEEMGERKFPEQKRTVGEKFRRVLSELMRWLGLRPKPAKNPRRPILQLPRKYDKDGLLYHNFRFGLVGNFRVLMCRMLGHRLSKKPGHYCCQRCGLAYEEIYHKKGKGYYIEAGIVEDDDTRVPAQVE